MNSVQDILSYLYREIEEMDYDIKRFKEQMDNAIPFGQEYWRIHDRYHSAFIKWDYLRGIVQQIERG